MLDHTPATQPLDGIAINCERDGLHMCRVSNPDMLTVFWPYIRAGLDRIREKCHPRQHWLAEHVRLDIQRGLVGQCGTECFLAHYGPRFVKTAPRTYEHEGTHQVRGFLVTTAQIDPFVNLPLRWFVWMGVLDSDTFVALMPEFERLAKERGYRGYSWTGRPGWSRAPFVRQFGIGVVEYIVGKDFD